MSNTLLETLSSEIINGKWAQSSPEFLTPRINGQGLITYAISSLKDHLNRLPTSETDQVYFQIIAFNNTTWKYPEFQWEMNRNVLILNRYMIK